MRIDEDARKRGNMALDLLERCSLSNPRILEVGCSTGWLSCKLQRHGSVTGVDLSAASVEVARSRVRGAHFLAGDFLRMDLNDHLFDVVVLLETVAHVEDKLEFCRRVSSLLTPGGYFIITAQNARVWEWSGVLTKPPEILQDLLTMSELKQLLSSEFRLLRSGTTIPFGHRGFLRFLNSRKLNRPFVAAFGEDRVARAKESLGLGNTLFALAQKPEERL